jgi:hypothetical protein
MFRYDKKRAVLSRPPSSAPLLERRRAARGVTACVAVLTTPFKAGPKHLQRLGCIRMIRRKKGGRSRPFRSRDRRSASLREQRPLFFRVPLTVEFRRLSPPNLSGPNDDGLAFAAFPVPNEAIGSARNRQIVAFAAGIDHRGQGDPASATRATRDAVRPHHAGCTLALPSVAKQKRGRCGRCR